MLHLVDTSRHYDPETVAVMAAAYDAVRKTFSARITDSAEMHRQLALIILRHVDQGERDAARLSNIALRELTGSDRAATG